MQSTSPSAEKRADFFAYLFPNGVPSLWCPLLTHYDSKGGISEGRMIAHLRHLSPFIKGYLIPGSTGDGWELRDRETQRVIEIALQQAQAFEFSLLIGLLKPNIAGVLAALDDIVQRLMDSTRESDPLEALNKARVCGFAVCPPSGKQVQQQEILSGLAEVLDRGFPTALYQLPQVTKNEMSAATIKELADRFPNFIFFKDSSGSDRVAYAQKDLGGVFTARGAETDYCKWLDGTRVHYDGFLLSTTNCFARELSEMIDQARSGRGAPARRVSEMLSAIILEVFQVVSPLRSGNAFANANKAMDHWFAYGSKATETLPPRLHDGTVIPVEIIRRAAEVLARHDVLPRDGYLTRKR